MIQRQLLQPSAHRKLPPYRSSQNEYGRILMIETFCSHFAQVCAMFRAGDIRRNVLLKFIRLCMETPRLRPAEGHKYGGRKLTKKFVIEFCYKKPVSVF